MELKVVTALALERLMDAGLDTLAALRLHTDPPPALREGDPYDLAPLGAQSFAERGPCLKTGHHHDMTILHTEGGLSMVLVSEWDGAYVIVADDEYPCWLDDDEDLPPWLADR
jgi:hypothetical protein